LMYHPDERSVLSASTYGSCYSDQEDDSGSLTDASCSSRGSLVSLESSGRRGRVSLGESGCGGGGQDRTPPISQAAPASDTGGAASKSRAETDGGEDGQRGNVVRMGNAVGETGPVGGVLTIEQKSQQASGKPESGRSESKAQNRMQHSDAFADDEEEGEWTTFDEGAFSPAQAPHEVGRNAADGDETSAPTWAARWKVPTPLGDADDASGTDTDLDDVGLNDVGLENTRIRDPDVSADLAPSREVDSETHSQRAKEGNVDDNDGNAATEGESMFLQLSSAIQRAAGEVTDALESVDVSVLAPSTLAKNFSLKEWELDSLMGVLRDEMDGAPVRGYLDLAPSPNERQVDVNEGRSRRSRRKHRRGVSMD